MVKLILGTAMIAAQQPFAIFNRRKDRHIRITVLGCKFDGFRTPGRGQPDKRMGFGVEPRPNGDIAVLLVRAQMLKGPGLSPGPND